MCRRSNPAIRASDARGPRLRPPGPGGPRRPRRRRQTQPRARSPRRPRPHPANSRQSARSLEAGFPSPVTTAMPKVAEDQAASQDRRPEDREQGGQVSETANVMTVRKPARLERTRHVVVPAHEGTGRTSRWPPSGRPRDGWVVGHDAFREGPTGFKNRGQWPDSSTCVGR